MRDPPPLRRAAHLGLDVELRAIRTHGRRWPRHWHADLQLIATVDGRGCAWIEGVAYDLPRGALVMIPPGMVHTAYEADAVSGWTFLSLHAAPERVAVLSEDVAPLAVEAADPPAVAFRETVARLLSGPRDALEPAWLRLLDQLAKAPPRLRPPVDPAMADARRRLAETSATRLPIPAVAEQLGMPRRSFERAFAAAFQLSPHAWRVIARVEAAKAALRGGASVAEAASCAGYADLRHFSRQYRDVTGITARAYASSSRRTLGARTREAPPSAPPPKADIIP